MDTCSRCRAPVGSKDTAAVHGPNYVCYWAAGQRSETAYDECARRAGVRLATVESLLGALDARALEKAAESMEDRANTIAKTTHYAWTVAKRLEMSAMRDDLRRRAAIVRAAVEKMP